MRLGEIWGLVSEGKKRKVTGKLATFIRWSSILIVAYHIYNAVFTMPFDILFQGKSRGHFLIPGLHSLCSVEGRRQRDQYS
ncbi:MAG: hypothetical protein ACOX37_06395 [Bacillota bacterium]